MFQFIVAKLGVRFIPLPSELKFFFGALKTGNILFFFWNVGPSTTVPWVRVAEETRGQRRSAAALALTSPSLRRGGEVLAGS